MAQSPGRRAVCSNRAAICQTRGHSCDASEGEERRGRSTAPSGCGRGRSMANGTTLARLDRSVQTLIPERRRRRGRRRHHRHPPAAPGAGGGVPAPSWSRPATSAGGTWYWNRYPAPGSTARATPTATSSPRTCSTRWAWTEHFAAQPETERYLNHVVDRFDLRRDMRFDRADARLFDPALCLFPQARVAVTPAGDRRCGSSDPGCCRVWRRRA